MWGAIATVSSSLTLIAFLAAVIAWYLKSKLDKTARLIKTAPEQDRRDLVSQALEVFNVDTAKLSGKQQLEIALTHIREREKRYGISAIVVCFLALVAAGVTAFAITQREGSSPPFSPNGIAKKSVDPGLVGDWSAVGKYFNTDVQLRLYVNSTGSFSLHCFVDDAGSINTDADVLRLIGKTIVSNIPFQYHLDKDSLLLSDNARIMNFERVKSNSSMDDKLAGVWVASLLIDGARWEITLYIGDDKNYRLHAEAHDQGGFRAADGEWEMTATNWSARPRTGVYKVFERGNPHFQLYPFGDLVLERAL
jgi:hypothetical protein